MSAFARAGGSRDGQINVRRLVAAGVRSGLRSDFLRAVALVLVAVLLSRAMPLLA